MGVERKLAAAIKAGNNEAWGDFYSLYHTRMVRLCSHFTQDYEQAEDLAHESLIKLKEHISTFEEGEHPGPWLYRIARNVCLDFIRKHRKENLWTESAFARTSALHQVDTRPGPSTAMHKQDARTRLFEALNGLDEDHRTVVVLKYMDGLSRAEIASAMEIPEATVKSRLYYGMKKLRLALNSE